MKILDCTIRDGGYYTNWDFDKDIIRRYFESMENLPIDYIEIGYRNPNLSGYFGEYYFLPEYTLKYCKELSSKNLAIILNEKDVRVEMLDDLLNPCQGIIRLVRIAIDPKNFTRALDLAKGIKERGFEVAFNVMYMSNWSDYPDMISQLEGIENIVDYFYMVDSFGGVYPSDVRSTIKMVRSKTSVALGFHGHNNLELALANTLAAIEEGVEIVDATVTGMGRGAGNLKTELLLTVLDQKKMIKTDFNALSETTADFDGMQRTYEWGTSLPYMVAGANSFPQKTVMDWILKRCYSINSIVRAIGNKVASPDYSHQFPVINSNINHEEVLIIGGGPSVQEHEDGILNFIQSRKGLVLIHSSSRNAKLFQNVSVQQYLALVGNEGSRFEKVYGNLNEYNGICLLPPYPREMGTYVPIEVKPKTFELKDDDFFSLKRDTNTAIALQTAFSLNARKVFVVGYDGYSNVEISQAQREIFNENDRIFERISKEVELITLTPSKYSFLKKHSIYQYS
ncbi:aldolase catalytic domain-containing protein [Schleiferiaceae bacterium]|nr:aldolase catalytic domain-containing protein [Schleiferiaceae bacterium]